MDSGHWSLIIIVVLIVGLVSFYEMLKRPDDNYAKGAVHNEVTENNYPLSLHPCGALFTVSGIDKKKR